MRTMQVDVVTPDHKVFSEQAEMVVAEAAEGEIGILPGHTPFVSTLKIGPVRIKMAEHEQIAAVSGGFIEVHNDHVTILAETAELPGDIDLERARAAKERAERRLERVRDDEIDFRRAELALHRAMNRINVANRR
ncbi:F0F1 ATP synthase subunit epsilon [Numidum massiliense]|uniref:F0F1 ATP synthase subunit epsilon n=1 Tax=Numidum massiliense TaxID=1522315 RepID=UPI0006D56ED8|nr:F0F1 ATP synthase subunit epsilon [Numidum massiliense]